MSSQSEVIETTVSKVADELLRRGLDPDDRVTITIEPDELIPAGGKRARVRSTSLRQPGGNNVGHLTRILLCAKAEARRRRAEGVTLVDLRRGYRP